MHRTHALCVVFMQLEDLPVTASLAAKICDVRRNVANVVAGNDDRLLVIVGPCSIHDTKAAKEVSSIALQ